MYAYGVIASGLMGVMLFHKWIAMKFLVRPFIWGQLFKNMFYNQNIDWSPFLGDKIPVAIKPWLSVLVGSGFSKTLDGNYTWVDRDVFGWVYRHNDYLSLGSYAGAIALGLLIWFLVRSIKLIGVRPVLILFMAILIQCFFQLTMFELDKACICLVLGTLCIAESYKKEEIV